MFAHFCASILPTKVRLEVGNISLCMGYAHICQAEKLVV